MEEVKAKEASLQYVLERPTTVAIRPPWQGGRPTPRRGGRYPVRTPV